MMVVTEMKLATGIEERTGDCGTTRLRNDSANLTTIGTCLRDDVVFNL